MKRIDGLTVAALMLGALGGLLPTRIPEAPAQEAKVHDSSRVYERIRQLGKVKDTNGLREIASLDSEYENTAVCELVRVLDGNDAVKLCKRYEGVPLLNESTVAALGQHDKSTVMPYLLDLMQCHSPCVKAACYKLCKRNAWTELSIFAQSDQYSEEPLLILPNQVPWEATLGDVAKRYLESLQGGGKK